MRTLILSIVILSASFPAVASEAGAFVGDWAMRMTDGSSGWLSIKDVDGRLTGELWRVGQGKAITNMKLADGKLTFTRQCRIGKPEYDGGPPTGERVPCDFKATVEGNSIHITMQTANGVAPVSKVIHQGKRLPPLPQNLTCPMSNLASQSGRSTVSI